MSGIKDVKRRNARRRRRKKQRHLLVLFLLLALFIGVIGGARAVMLRSKEDKAAKTAASSNKTDKTTADESDQTNSDVDVQEIKIDTGNPSSEKEVSITISSMGDCTLGTDVNFNQSTSLNAYYNMNGPDYFFQNVRSILEKDDLSIVNMEGTLTDSTTREDKTYAFKAPAEYAGILSGSSVEAANLANNHSSDYGSQSTTDTIKALEDAGVATFGFDQIKILDIKGVKIGLTGIYELAEHMGKAEQVKENITALKEAGAQLIIVNFHWGVEKEYYPNDTQKQLAHLAVDSGADLVIGHHPHVLQGVEKYKDKYIAYSLGNFCFGGNSNPSDKDTMIVQQTFTFHKGELKDSSDLNLIPCSLSSTSSHNDYCPTPLEGNEKQRVLDKITQYSTNL
ncbi:CapA family protein [Faecalicatena contorta]|uniref:CapA family protein n=1 Tax=Faecalicatena contorta TaxID=39482 RepID=UPI0030250B5C|nr:CapA family protein [Faecalicatena contorta]